MSRRELFASLCATVFLVNLARVVFAPLVQPVAADFDVTAASLGVVTSAAWLGSAAPRLPTGYLLTRVARHHVVGATGVLLALTSVFTAFSSSILHLTAGAFLMGLSSGIYFIAANPLVSELFPTRVGRSIGVHGMSSQLAAVSAPLLVSAVLLIADWRTTFLCVTVVAAATTLFLVWAARRTELPAAGTTDRSLLAAARVQWPLILLGIAIAGVGGFLWNGLFNLYGDYLTVTKGIEPATGRALLSLMFVAGVPAFGISGRLADRFPNVPLLLAVVGGFAVSVFALTIAEGTLALAVMSLLVGAAFFSLVPVVDTYLLSSFPDRHRASAYAIYSSVMMFVQALGSGTVGVAVARGAGYTATFRSLALVVGVMVAILLVLYRAGALPSGGGPGSDTAPGRLSD